MFPLYLLAAQANLGLRRGKQCEDLLGLACWLTNTMPHQTTNVMTSQLNRLYGQLYALQGRHSKALEAFAADVYCCSEEFGPLDARTSLGFYNLGKVLQAMAETAKAHANYAVVVKIWVNALTQAVLGMPPLDTGATLKKSEKGKSGLPLGTLQLIEVCNWRLSCPYFCCGCGQTNVDARPRNRQGTELWILCSGYRLLLRNVKGPAGRTQSRGAAAVDKCRQDELCR